MVKKTNDSKIEEMKGKQAALETALAALKKKGIELCNTPKKVEAFSTGILSLDCALGVGGLPRGRVVEIYGPEAGGKTSLALYIAAQLQKAGEVVAMVDAEHALDPSYASILGVDTDKMLINQPDSGEAALETVEALAASGAVSFVIVDSVAALVPKAEIEGDIGDSHVGAQARLLGQALRKLTSIAAKGNCTVVFINQLRQKIGIMFGNPETTPGGLALKFFASVRLDVRVSEKLKDPKTNEIIAQHVKVKVVKNKVAPPYKVAEFYMVYGSGPDHTADVFDMGVMYNLITLEGKTYHYGAEKLGVGANAAKQVLDAKPEVVAEIRKKVLDIVFASHKKAAPEENSNEAETAAPEENNA